MQHDFEPSQRKLSFIILTFSLLSIIYSNTLHSPWQMDDNPNIVDNTRIHIDNLMPSTLYGTFFANPGSQVKLYRPIPMMTFAMNWYLGKDNPFGYHLVNIFLHILTAFVLFFVINLLFKTPVLQGNYRSNTAFAISTLSTILWATNPIQTQAVTYIVQRMTILATLFYLLGILFYLKARIIQVPSKRIIYFFGCFFCFLFSLGSKENTAIFPITLIFVELVFFQDEIIQKLKSPRFSATIAFGVIIFLVLVMFFTKGNPFFFLEGYGHRTFNWVERLLSQPRVVLFYLSLTFYPLPQRLSVDHSVRLSASPLEPWTTLPAIFILLFLTAFGVFQLKKHPLVGFPICFFILNHLIESTVIPLEIIFEHRNYLPSAFVFLPISCGAYYLIDLYRKKRTSFSVFLFVSVSSIIFLSAIGTYTRNMAWASKKSLWEDAVLKAPQNARPLVNLAIELAWNEKASRKDLKTALMLLYRAIPLYTANDFHRAEIFSNIGWIYSLLQDFKKSIFYYEKALLMDPFNIVTRYNLAQTLILTQRWEKASEHLDFVIKNGSGKFKYFNLKGFVLLWQNRPHEAIYYLREAQRRAPDNASVLMNLGVALNQLGSHKNAKWFLRRAIRFSPKDVYPYFALIDNAVKANKLDEAEIFAQELLSIQSIDNILDELAKLHKNLKSAPISDQLVAPIIRKTLLRSTGLLSEDDSAKVSN